MRWTAFLPLAATSMLASPGLASVLSFTDLSDWRSAAGLPGPGTDASANQFSAWATAEHIEDFTSIPDQLSAIGGTISNGTSTWWGWGASSGSAAGAVGMGTGPGGSRMLYAAPAGAALQFDFPAVSTASGGFLSGLHGFGGNFRFFSVSGMALNGRLIISMSSGESVIRNFSAVDSFAGFWLTSPDATITGVTVQPFGNAVGGAYVGAHALYLGYAGSVVPAPGAIALLGAAGLVGAIRRRS